MIDCGEGAQIQFRRSRGKDEFYATMIFYQSGNRKNALSGSGVEIDEVYDGKGEVEDSQTLEFTWYIDNNGDIYIRYAKSGATFVLDAGASQTGFHLGAEQGRDRYTFYGYMIGVGSAKGDVITFSYFDRRAGKLVPYLLRSNSSGNFRVPYIKKFCLSDQGILWICDRGETRDSSATTGCAAWHSTIPLICG